jgi:hypothetical protein
MELCRSQHDGIDAYVVTCADMQCHEKPLTWLHEGVYANTLDDEALTLGPHQKGDLFPGFPVGEIEQVTYLKWKAHSYLSYALSSHTRCISMELAGIGWKFLTYLAKIFCSFSCRMIAAGASSTMTFTAAS